MQTVSGCQHLKPALQARSKTGSVDRIRTGGYFFGNQGKKELVFLIYYSY